MSENIPPIDLKRQYQLIGEEIAPAVLEVLNSGRYIGGKTVLDFEQQFTEYIGTSECVACNSGTDALYLALRALNIGMGDEVITTSFSFFATCEVISRVGAKPVFIDIDSRTYNLDIDAIEGAITKNTKAILPVHLFGQPTNMTELMRIAQKYNLWVIEDCAQATGAEWGEQKVGSIGHVGCFSFFPTKNLGACGDGGAIVTNDRALALKTRQLKEHGSPARYLHDAIGINSRLDGIQAVILQVKLRYLERWNEQRAKVAKIYQELLELVPGITLPKAILGGKSVWNQYTIAIASEKTVNRDTVRRKLEQKGAIAMVYYPIPLHLQPAYKDLGYREGSFPVAEKAAREVLSLPMFPEISYEEQQRVVYALKDCLVR
jgi:dTDP-4-amino-4,6-dideoxygalactose transaminase